MREFKTSIGFIMAFQPNRSIGLKYEDWRNDVKYPSRDKVNSAQHDMLRIKTNSRDSNQTENYVRNFAFNFFAALDLSTFFSFHFRWVSIKFRLLWWKSHFIPENSLTVFDESAKQRETLSTATPLHISHVSNARFDSNGAANQNDEFFIGSNVDASIWKHEYHHEFQQVSTTRKKECGEKHSFLAFQLITRINVCMNEYETRQRRPERDRKYCKFTWVVIPMVFRCRNLSYPNSVRFSWCRTAPAHLNNRFSAIQSTAHNFHWRCAHGVCLLRTNEQIARDVFACDSTFFDIAEWTISEWGKKKKQSENENFPN